MLKFNSELETVKIPEYFNDIRPYTEQEALDAISRVAKSEKFFKALTFLLPEDSIEFHKKTISEIKTVYEFQLKIMGRVIDRIINKTADNLSYTGLENIEKDKSCVFVSNHRDIFLDSGILQLILVNNGYKTTEITFGSNLMKDSLLVDIGKINKMFKVYREGKPKELSEKAQQLSEYIRYTIIEKNESVWIAQRGGRTKNGYDKTQAAVLKMFNSSGKGTFEDNMRELNIVPVSVSYQYEPCDALKVKELYNSIDGQYKKNEDEDLKSIVQGIIQEKGKINISISKPLNNELAELEKYNKINEKANALAAIIDKIIYKNYKLWAQNYIAADLLFSQNKYSEFYTEDEKSKFEIYCKQSISSISGDKESLLKMFLEIYATPVFNSEK